MTIIQLIHITQSQGYKLSPGDVGVQAYNRDLGVEPTVGSRGEPLSWGKTPKAGIFLASERTKEAENLPLLCIL